MTNESLSSSPMPANDNWGIASDWQTPAEAMQSIHRMQADMRRELVADFTLRSDPQHRQEWETLIEMEKCALWQFYRIRRD